MKKYISTLVKSKKKQNNLSKLNPQTKAIVPYGTNQSIYFGHKLTQLAKSMYKLTFFLHQVILGLLLGDG
jgi:hypothetical protein